MRFGTKTRLVLLAVFCSAIYWIQPAYSDVIVNWGGAYVADDSQNLSGNTFLGAYAGSGYSGTPFSASTEFSPLVVPESYAGTNARFYGGAVLVHQGDTTTKDAFENARIKNQGGNDSVQLKATQGGHFHSMHAVFLWNQADFLTGNSPVTFDANTTASVRVGQASTETLNNASLRMVVRDLNGAYWLSGYAFSNLSNNTTYTWDSGTQGFGAATDGMWTTYNPTAELGTLGAGTDLHLNSVNPVLQDLDFAGISAVGFLFDQDVYHNNLEFHWENFSVNAVPEPSGFLLSAISLIAINLRVRHRRTRA